MQLLDQREPGCALTQRQRNVNHASLAIRRRSLISLFDEKWSYLSKNHLISKNCIFFHSVRTIEPLIHRGFSTCSGLWLSSHQRFDCEASRNFIGFLLPGFLLKESQIWQILSSQPPMTSIARITSLATFWGPCIWTGRRLQAMPMNAGAHRITRYINKCWQKTGPLPLKAAEKISVGNYSSWYHLRNFVDRKID